METIEELRSKIEDFNNFYCDNMIYLNNRGEYYVYLYICILS